MVTKNRINELLIENSHFLSNPSLLRGKMGLSLFLYTCGELTDEDDKIKKAEQDLTHVLDIVMRQPLPPHFEDGLAGIGWGIEYLIKNGLIDANPDEMLEDIDTTLFQLINERARDLTFNIQKGVLGYTLYFYYRILDKEFKLRADDESLFFRRVIIDLVNSIARLIDAEEPDFVEPRYFNIWWDLPCCLFVLGKIKRLNLYDQKIERIIDDISPIVLSSFPRNSGNRFNLVLGMMSLDYPCWANYIKFLKESITETELLDDLNDRNLHFENGLAGLIFIKEQAKRYDPVFGKMLTGPDLLSRIYRSSYWKSIEGREFRELGLSYGITGILWAIFFLELPHEQVDI